MESLGAAESISVLIEFAAVHKSSGVPGDRSAVGDSTSQGSSGILVANRILGVFSVCFGDERSQLTLPSSAWAQ